MGYPLKEYSKEHLSQINGIFIDSSADIKNTEDNSKEYSTTLDLMLIHTAAI
jgi:hypothetical protein